MLEGKKMKWYLKEYFGNKIIRIVPTNIFYNFNPKLISWGQEIKIKIIIKAAKRLTKNWQKQITNTTRVQKITNVPLFKKLWHLIFFCGTITLWAISRDILRGPRLFWPLNCPERRGQKSLGPLKMSLEMAHKVIVPQKKIMSCSFLNSGTLIVISSNLFVQIVKRLFEGRGERLTKNWQKQITNI